MLKEVCVESSTKALIAQKEGADRIELCKNLDEGGLTPSFLEIKKSFDLLTVPLKVMIRCRPGNFFYNKEEIDKMLEDLQKIKNLGIKEVVFGAIDENYQINISTMKIIADEAYPMSITFHKAIDLTLSIKKELKKLSKIENVKSILTSGGKNTAEEGESLLKELVIEFKGKFEIIVAGSVTQNNLQYLHKRINANEYHGRNILKKV
ncbi:MAG: copper homeostasis protein CutC [Candidatus Marinimicrobia bacterium]|nr:copper homeostasis protein CutC [Candidatus Neomarinimicrobiota bacterium]